MLAVTGYNTTIVKELRWLLPDGETVERVECDECGGHARWDADRYLLCAGLLRPKKLEQQTQNEVDEGLFVNLIQPMRQCDYILETNSMARVCLVGSESGYSWSHDGVYAAAKAALHKYVETKKLKPSQQLICIAPSIIEDSGMTQRRTDLDNLARRKAEHPKQRFLRAVEVARLIHFVLYVDDGYLSNTVIRINGGGR